VVVVVSVNSDGRREVLGLVIGPSKTEPFWTDFLRRRPIARPRVRSSPR